MRERMGKSLRERVAGAAVFLVLCMGLVLTGCGAVQQGEEEEKSSHPIVTEIPPGEQDVRIPIQIRGEENNLTGKLVMPDKGGDSRPPLVIMVQGSGQSDYNETIGTAGNAPFRDIAEGLSERGIASLRYNKRYYEHPDMAGEKITIEDEVLEDVNFAIRYIEELGCSSEIYIMGHSLGAMVAPVIARDNPGVAGIICLAGSPRHLQDIIYDQNAAALERQDELTDREKNQQLAMLKQVVEKIDHLTADSTGNYLGVDAGYWYSLNQLRQGEAAKKLEIPILMLQGREDFQVYADVDFKQWKKLLKGKKNVKFHLYPGLNHLFMESQGRRDVSEYNVAAKVSDEVIADMADFLLK